MPLTQKINHLLYVGIHSRPTCPKRRAAVSPRFFYAPRFPGWPGGVLGMTSDERLNGRGYDPAVPLKP